MEKLLEKKLLQSDIAFQKWKLIPFKKRQQLIAQLSQILKDKKDIFGKLITKEMHKPISQSIAEIEKCALMCDYYANIDNVLQPEKVISEFDIAEIHFVPKGVILGVMPWNFPFWQVLRFAVPTILAGNTVVLKHASICFESGDAIENLFVEAGFAVGVLQNLKIGHSEVKTVIQHPSIQGVSLTGSEKAGADVAALAGRNIKKSLLELGGSDAFIVLEDADLDQAAEVGAWARLQNCGQTCVAAKRFIIQKKIKEEFLSKFIKAYQKYQPNNPNHTETKLSGMARPDLANELQIQYKKALKSGAEIIIPLERISENQLRPGLISVQSGNPILQEELFGPLAIIMIADNLVEALSLANAIPFGLSNSVWTRNKNTQQYFIDHLQSGSVNINKMTSSDPRFPFGGTKKSGYGAELSTLALREFVTAKTVLGKF